MRLHNASHSACVAVGDVVFEHEPSGVRLRMVVSFPRYPGYLPI